MDASVKALVPPVRPVGLAGHQPLLRRTHRGVTMRDLSTIDARPRKGQTSVAKDTPAGSAGTPETESHLDSGHFSTETRFHYPQSGEKSGDKALSRASFSPPWG